MTQFVIQWKEARNRRRSDRIWLFSSLTKIGWSYDRRQLTGVDLACVPTGTLVNACCTGERITIDGNDLPVIIVSLVQPIIEINWHQDGF